MPRIPTSFLSCLNLHPSSICLPVHLIDTESVVISLWVMLVLADPPDRCWTRGLLLSHTAHTYSLIRCGSLDTRSQRNGRVHGSPASVFFAFPSHPHAVLPAHFLLRSCWFLLFCLLAEANSNWFTRGSWLGFLWFVIVQFHRFHQSITLDKTTDFDVCLKNVGQAGHKVCTHKFIFLWSPCENTVCVLMEA